MSSVFRERLLAGQHAFLTGGTSGIGRAIADRLSEGAKISLVGRDAKRLDCAVSEFQGCGRQAHGCAAKAGVDMLTRTLALE